MRAIAAIALCGVCFAALGLIGCGEPTLPPTTPGGGFIIETLYFNGPILLTGKEVTVDGYFQKDLANAAGDPHNFFVVTNNDGLASVLNGRAPALWEFVWGGGIYTPESCQTALGNGKQLAVGLHSLVQITCYPTELDMGLSGAISPSTLYTQALPANVTVAGSGFTSTYGMPVLQYYDLNGTLVAQSTAASVSADGTSMQVATPNLSQVPTGTYVGLIQNQVSGGGLSLAGSGSVTVVAPPGYITYVAHAYSCTPYEQGTIYWTQWDTFVWNDASGIVHSFPAAVSDFPGGQCGGGPPYTMADSDTYGYTIHVTAGSPSGPPSAYITGPGGTQYPIVLPL